MWRLSKIIVNVPCVPVKRCCPYHLFPFPLKSVLHVNVLHRPGTHATRWLASVHIVFLKRLADFFEKYENLYYSYVDGFQFST